MLRHPVRGERRRRVRPLGVSREHTALRRGWSAKRGYWHLLEMQLLPAGQGIDIEHCGLTSSWVWQ